LLKIEKKTVIFVTHSIEEAAYLSDQIVLLSQRPGTVLRIIQPNVGRGKSPDEIRRDKGYLDAVDEIWQILKRYV
jgi:NitT/TauT family transport system ATP-binding protein